MPPKIQTYYISLTKDLLGYYLVVKADSERAVRQYLEREYFQRVNASYGGIWKLPWCAIYLEEEVLKRPFSHGAPKTIHIGGVLHADN